MKLSPILLFPTGAVAPEPTTPPSLRTPATADRICAAIRESGLSDRSAAALVGVSSSEMERWRREDPAFASRLAVAREEFRDACLLVIRTRGSPTARSTAMRRRGCGSMGSRNENRAPLFSAGAVTNLQHPAR